MSEFVVPTEQNISDKNKRILGELKGLFGIVPNIFAAFASSENGLENYFNYGREVGRMMVNITPGILRAGYTGVDLSQRRNGYGKKLVDAVVDYTRKNNLKVIPECGFVAQASVSSIKLSQCY